MQLYLGQALLPPSWGEEADVTPSLKCVEEKVSSFLLNVAKWERIISFSNGFPVGALCSCQHDERPPLHGDRRALITDRNSSCVQLFGWGFEHTYCNTEHRVLNLDIVLCVDLLPCENAV